MDIYIKPAKKISIAEKNQVFIRDFAEVVATKDVADHVKAMKVLDINASEKAKLLISITDVIKVIKKSYPDYTVNNVGEMDTVVEYMPHKSADNSVVKWLKIAFVALVLFMGSSTAIMSFHSDAQIPEVFKNYYKIFFGKETEKPLIIDIPYSLGLAAGIIVFFNHIAGKKITDDPTPIEVEMTLYETEVTDTQIDVLNTEKIRMTENKESNA